MNEPAARETFDPYYKWLGIPPKDQPPHYYRLLAIDLFESDADVISAAADKQMAFVRSFQAGKNAPFSQKILNEISAARVCLLNAMKKAEYDGALRSRMAAESASALKKIEPIPVAAPAPAQDAVILMDELFDADIHRPIPIPMGGSERSQIRKKNSLKSSVVPLVALGAMLVLCVAAVAVVMSRPPKTDVSRGVEDPADDPAGNKPGNAELAPRRAAASGSGSQVPANSATPALVKSPIGPIGSNASNVVDPAAKGPQSASVPGTPHTEPTENPHVENRPDIKPRVDNRPSGGTVAIEPKSGTSAEPAESKPVEAKKIKTLEELDKELADAKTTEDYQGVASDALHAAGKAIEDHQQDLAKPLILKSLVAARKSGDSKLIIKVTRALTKPDSIKEILAEMDKPEEDLSADQRRLRESSPRLQGPVGETVVEMPGAVDRTRPVTAGTKRVALRGTSTLGVSLGSVRQGTLITLQYEGGTWSNPVTHASINPDDASLRIAQVAITARAGGFTNLILVPAGTSVRPYRWRADRDYDSAFLHCNTPTMENLTGRVLYRLTITPVGQ